MVISLTLLGVVFATGGAGSFWLFVGLCVVAWVFVYFRVPETTGKTLEEIEAESRGVRVATGRVH